MKISDPKKLPSGNWNVRVMVDGRRISITKPTRKACLEEAAALKVGLKKAAVDPEDKTLAQAYDDHIRDITGDISPSTLAGYLRLRRNTFQPLMPYKLKRITPAAVKAEMDAMRTAGKSPKYISNAYGLLHSVMSQNGIDLKVEQPKKRKPNLRLLADDEIEAIVRTATGTEMELPILLSLWMGLRLSEIRGIKAGDIRRGKLHICRAVVDGPDGRPVEKDPKTYAGNRLIALPDYIAGLIPAVAPDEYIIKLSGQAIYKRFSRLLDKAGVEHCRFHDLRAANAAVMIALNVDSKYAQQRNGWSSDYMYKQVYGYTMPDRMSAVNDAINGYFGNKIGNKN